MAAALLSVRLLVIPIPRRFLLGGAAFWPAPVLLRLRRIQLPNAVLAPAGADAIIAIGLLDCDQLLLKIADDGLWIAGESWSPAAAAGRPDRDEVSGHHGDAFVLGQMRRPVQLSVELIVHHSDAARLSAMQAERWEQPAIAYHARHCLAAQQLNLEFDAVSAAKLTSAGRALAQPVVVERYWIELLQHLNRRG